MSQNHPSHKSSSDWTPLVVFVIIVITVFAVISSGDVIANLLDNAVNSSIPLNAQEFFIYTGIAALVLGGIYIIYLLMTAGNPQSEVKNVRLSHQEANSRASHPVAMSAQIPVKPSTSDTMAAKKVRRDNYIRMINRTMGTDTAWVTTPNLLLQFPEYVSLGNESGQELAQSRLEAKRLKYKFELNPHLFSDADLGELWSAAVKYEKSLELNKKLAIHAGVSNWSAREQDILNRVALMAKLVMDENRSNRSRETILRDLSVMISELKNTRKDYVAVLVAALQKELTPLVSMA